MKFEIFMLITQRDTAYYGTSKGLIKIELPPNYLLVTNICSPRCKATPINQLSRPRAHPERKKDQDQAVILSAEELNTHCSTASLQSWHLPSTIPFTQTQSTDQALNTSRETFSFRNVDEIEVKIAILRVKSTAIGLD
jgi:hypothetical protein